MGEIKYSIPDENGGYKQVTRDNWEAWICDYSEELEDANRLLLDVARAARTLYSKGAYPNTQDRKSLRNALTAARAAGINLEEGET